MAQLLSSAALPAAHPVTAAPTAPNTKGWVKKIHSEAYFWCLFYFQQMTNYQTLHKINFLGQIEDHQ